ncbi:MAG: sigma-70 family RNA polymerase sigma factor [Lachnospiraceae bacterium]|nr:sigma-70 family RNA polymerase sigma factor [Lachnospiraceae bacterium]
MKEKQLIKLVEAMATGDDKAFEKIYKQTSNNIYFICMSFLHNEEDAKDIMQDTYISAYQYISQLKEKEKFIPWLSQIAVNKCKSYLIRTTPLLIDDQEFVNVRFEENENFLPEEYITKKEKRKIVMDIMRNTLSDIQYQTVILYYFNGLSVYEVADIMECPPGTVTYRLSVARAKIKDGVMAYENKYDEKLYASAGVPFLASLFAAEVIGLQAPNVFPQIVSTLSGTGVTGVAANTAIGVATKTGFGALKAKIAVGLAATAIAGAGAAAIIIHNNSDDKKEPTNYERFEEMNYVALVDYFKEEYGFVEDMTFESRDEEDEKTIYFLVKEKNNERLRLQIEVPFGSDMPNLIVVCRYAQNFNEDYDEWVDVSSFVCASDEEREELKDFMLNHSDEERVIGEYKYKAMFGGGYASDGESARYLVVYLNWNE